jgi:hypothetical protein
MHMPIQDPVAVHDAASDDDAVLIRNALIAAGIEAYVSESEPQAESHQPQVWVDRSDLARAAQVVYDYESQAWERRANQQATENLEPIDVVCDCGQTTRFSALQRGTVEECPACGAFLDVGEPDELEDWGTPEDEEAAEKEEEDTP